MRQQWIEEEAGELAVVRRIGDAEQILGTGPNDQFVDQRIPFAVHLLPRTFSADSSIAPADCDPFAIGFTVSSDHRLFLTGSMNLPIYGQHGDGNFQHDRVNVEARYCV